MQNGAHPGNSRKEPSKKGEEIPDFELQWTQLAKINDTGKRKKGFLEGKASRDCSEKVFKSRRVHRLRCHTERGKFQWGECYAWKKGVSMEDEINLR